MANKLKIKKGDLVQVIAGARESRGGDRGKQGKVLAVYPERNRVLVEGVNRVIKHKKATQTQAGGTAGGRETHEAPIHVSNVALVDPKDNKPTRVGYREESVERDGRTKTIRVRFSRRTGEEI
ncbi:MULTISPECIES: 50S ribosomal protein L24 [unclassified Brevibacterium]|uniref:50S ribosomal protein L24 n=1 Tax=unclassified Brevibacterium TaxID=2614124 RepID=UPI0010918692|nr:50S ribosomal protein L24 [Brevibacterium sp. S22]TGD30388.1 50S ribosomal protein L24 [Brevibacterium sp. S22]